MNHQINIDEAIAIAKEYHLETKVTEYIKQGMSPMEIISDLSKICSGTVILCKANEVIMPAYVLNNFNDIYYLYVQNRIMAIEIQHTVENDPITGDLYDEWYQIDSTLICDYCIIPEADYILKEDTSFLTKVLAQV